jgi:hypothetical protein
LAISGIANLRENISQQQFGQIRPETTNLAAIGATLIEKTAAPANFTDRFTPSNQGTSAVNGLQGLRLFRVAQRAQVAAASLPVAQSSTPRTVQNNAPAQAVAAPTQVATAAAVTAPVTPQVTQTLAIAPATQVAAIPDTTPATLQNQLQTLNTALSDLGLNTAQITKIDQIASVIQNFSPVAYSDLVYQLEALAQQPAQQTAAAAIGAPNTNANERV